MEYIKVRTPRAHPRTMSLPVPRLEVAFERSLSCEASFTMGAPVAIGVRHSGSQMSIHVMPQQVDYVRPMGDATTAFIPLCAVLGFEATHTSDIGAEDMLSTVCSTRKLQMNHVMIQAKVIDKWLPVRVRVVQNDSTFRPMADGNGTSSFDKRRRMVFMSWKDWRRDFYSN
jgi:hypothetical protein